MTLEINKYIHKNKGRSEVHESVRLKIEAYD